MRLVADQFSTAVAPVPSEGSYLIINKNLVEIGALAVIFATRSGHFAGFDRLVGSLIKRPRLATESGVA